MTGEALIRTFVVILGLFTLACFVVRLSGEPLWIAP